MKTTSEFRPMLLAALCAAAASASAAPMTGVRIPTTKAGESAALAKYINAGGFRAKRPAAVRPLIVFPITPVITAGAGGTLSFLPEGGSIATGGTVNLSNTASGGVVKTGAGTLSLGGNNAYLGGGVLQIGVGNNGVGSVITGVNGGGIFIPNPAGTIEGGLTNLGTLVLSDPFPVFGGAGSSSGGSINIASGGTLTSNWWTQIARNPDASGSIVTLTPTTSGVSIELPNNGVLNWTNGAAVSDGNGGVLTLRDGTIIREFVVAGGGGSAVIPEPGSGLLAAAGLVAFALRRRRNA